MPSYTTSRTDCTALPFK